MQKIMSTVAMVCLSFSCLAESYFVKFVKIADNEYVMQHGEKSEDLRNNNSDFGSAPFEAVAPIDAVYTPTHIFTYPDGNPAHFLNIQRIDYTESNVTFIKDIKTRKCCIDILDDKENSNKCRIIGVNGHEIIHIMNGSHIRSFEVYEVAGEANSFTDSTPRLIYVDHTGLYIVSEKENPIEDISKNYFLNRKFDFNGEIIKISAIDGKRETSQCAFDWPIETPMSFAQIPYSKLKFIPIMEQIKEITGVMPESAPPTFEAAKHRIVEILDIPEEMLIIEDEIIKIIGIGAGVIRTNAETQAYSNYKNVLDQLKFFSIARIRIENKWIETMRKEVYKNYKFDISPEAKKRRKEIALKPWDK